jgi:hypothetical protein
VFLLGYAENRAEAKSDPPGSQTIDKARVGPVIDRYLRVRVLRPCRVDRGCVHASGVDLAVPSGLTSTGHGM